MTLLLLAAFLVLVITASAMAVLEHPPTPVAPLRANWLDTVIDLTDDVCLACHRKPVSGLERGPEGAVCADPVSCALATSARLEAERVLS